MQGALDSPPSAARSGRAGGGGTLADAREAWLAPLERRYLVDLLAACEGNVRRAAAKADVDAATFYRLLKRRGVSVKRVPQVKGAKRSG
jgi:transcriptional regulator of acetoin/glycerol metabolism